MVQPLPSGTPQVVQRGGYFGRYVSSGHVVYCRTIRCFAVPFDVKRLAVTGPAARIGDRVESDATRGGAQLTMSEVGTMAYIEGRNRFDARPIAWMDRSGALAMLRAACRVEEPRVSPDGRRLAIDMRAAGQSDIFVYDWNRDTLTRVTFEGTERGIPVWTPRRSAHHLPVASRATDPSGYTIAWKRADGAGNAQVLVHDTVALRPGSWHPRLNVLAYVASVPGNSDDIMLLRVEGDEAQGWTPGAAVGGSAVDSPARERAPAFRRMGNGWRIPRPNPEQSSLCEAVSRTGPARMMVSNTWSDTSSWSRARSELVFAGPGVDYLSMLVVVPYRVENGSFRPLVSRSPGPNAPSPSARSWVTGRSRCTRTACESPSRHPPARETTARVHSTFVSHLFDHLRAVAPPRR